MTTLAFRTLGAISNSINILYPDQPQTDSIFFAYFNSACAKCNEMEVERAITNSDDMRMRVGISEFIRRLRQCIEIVDRTSKIKLFNYLAKINNKFQYIKDNSNKNHYNIRYVSSEDCCIYVGEWREAERKWTAFGDLLNYVCDSHNENILGVLYKMARDYPQIFWSEFWFTMCYIGLGQMNACKGHLLCIALELIHDPHHKECCVEGLRGQFAKIQALPREGAQQIFNLIMQRDSLREALIATEITIYPRAESLGNDTRNGLSMQTNENDVMRVDMPF